MPRPLTMRTITLSADSHHGSVSQDRLPRIGPAHQPVTVNVTDRSGSSGA